MFRLLVSLLLVIALTVNSAAAGIEALASNISIGVRLATQSEPDPFVDPVPSPEPPFAVGLDDTRNGMWTVDNLAILGEMELAIASIMSQPSGIPATSDPIQYTPPPDYADVALPTNVPPVALHSLWASLSLQSYNGDPGGGPALPWEASFPGGGSSGVETSVNSNTRNLTLRVPILSWKMKGGQEVDFSLFYNSRGNTRTLFGQNWSSTFDAWVYKSIGGLKLIVRWGDGSSAVFERANLQTNTFTSPNGLYQTIIFNQFTNTYTLHTKTGMKYVFAVADDFMAYLTQITERLEANVITITRHPAAKHTILSIADDKSRIAFDGNGTGSGYVRGIRDFNQDGGNRRWILGYTGSVLTSITYPQLNGQSPTRTFTYTETGNRKVLQTETDLRGKVWKWQISQSGLVTGYWTPILNESLYLSPAFTFVQSGDSLEYHLPNRYEYGGTLGSSYRHQYESGKIRHVYDPAGYYETYTWDNLRRIGSYRDRRAKTWAYLTDSNGNVTQVTHPVVNGEAIVEKYEYDEFSNLTWSYSDQVPGGAHKYEYTSTGRLAAVKRKASRHGVGIPEVLVQVLTYDGNGDLHTVTPHHPGGSGMWSLSNRNSLHFPQTVTDPSGNSTALTYDEWGRVRTIDPPGSDPATQIDYDSWGRPWKVTFPGAGAPNIQTTYDLEGNVTAIKDELNRNSYWLYDDDGRVIRYTNAKGEEEHYTYDACSFLKKVTNGRGFERHYVPNKRNDVYRLTQADGQREYWSYYATGDVASYTNGFGTADQTMSAYGVDALGRPTSVTYTPSNTPDVSFAYSNYGRTVSMNDGTGTTTWTYDGFNRLVSLNQPQGSISYGYSALYDEVTSMTDPSGTTTYEYDTFGRLKKLTNPLSEVTEWGYDAVGRVNKRTLHNGTWEDITYDSRSRVNWVLLKKPGPVTLRATGYTYDHASNVLTHAVGGVTTTYGYDNLNQLTSETRPGYAASYTYDANGNRATRTVNGVTETYVNDAADKLLSISVGGNVVRSFTYDALGRRKSDTHSGATTTYTWDQESRITSITRSGMPTHTFAYNGLDTRVSKMVGGTLTTYLRSGAYVTDGLLRETSGSMTTHHTPGISERRGAAATQYLHSGLKNADARTSGQAIDATRQYDAFGNLTTSSGSWPGPFGYAGGFGYQEDAESGLMLLGHRYYDSTTGRFLSKDPIEDGRNWYGYCDASPARFVDPTGLLTIAGDTSGWSMPAWLAPGNWPSHNGPSKEKAIRLLIETRDDSVGIWGHGMSGRIYVNTEEYLTRSDIEFVQRERERLGRQKFKSFVVNQCETFKDGDLLNAVLGISESVSGYTDLTSHQLRQTWTRPVHLGATLGRGFGKKAKKPGKVSGKPGSRG